MNAPQHFHWLAYYYGLREGRYLKPHHVRDGAAFAELTVPLSRRGLEYGRLVPNGPPTPEEFRERQLEFDRAPATAPRKVEDLVTYKEIDDSFLGPGETLVVPTRLPLSDLDHDDKVRSQPGFTTLEQRVFRACRPYLDVCCRSHVQLTPEAAEQLPKLFGNRANVSFCQVKEPWYQELAHLDPDLPREKNVHRKKKVTAAYVIYLRGVASLRGADLLVAWGMGGTQTLVLCHRLRADHAFLLDRPGFKMVEMTHDPDAPGGFGLDSGSWKMEVLFQMDPLH